MTALPSPSAFAELEARSDGSAVALVERLGLPPRSAGAKLVTLAVLAIQHGMWDQAIVALRQACAFHPDNADLLLELGLVYQHRQQPDLAFQTYNRVIEIAPRMAAVYANLSSLLVSTGRVELAIQASRIGIALNPEIGGLFINLAAALRADKQPDEAWATYKALLARQPHHPAGLTDSLHLRQHLNDWDGYEAHRRLVMAKSFRLGHRVPPFSVLTATDDPEEQRLAARAWNHQMVAQAPARLASYEPRSVEARARRLRIGYLSNDFHNHATALLLVELLELRDRDRFEAIGYSTANTVDGTLIRHRIISAFDVCYDVSGLADDVVAKKIKDDDIDILIDLKGFTSGARTEVMARRPAPIQVNYLGYPGTMGASFIDYILADAVVIPPERDADFDEKVVRLPGCYQPNDRKRPISPDPVSRADCGLPDDAFVFCSFNAPYKITPEMFDLWMRILGRVPGSVLWLLEGHPTGNANLHREAQARGIAPERVVLAPKRVTEQHLARMRLGDLFLDSFPVTAHTTASDALWVGLPVLTCPGVSFVSRVAASLLQAVGMPDMIVPTMADYEETAVALAGDPAALAAIRARLAANRLTSTLFDSERYTRHYEAALTAMVARMDAGLPVQSFDVPALPVANG